MTGQSRNSAMYQGRQQYEYNLCHKNHIRFTITEFYDAVSHETKFFLISEGLYMPRVIQDCPILLQNDHNNLMTEIASRPRRNVSSSTPIWKFPILKCYLFRSCTKITNTYIEAITRILDTNLSFHYCTYFKHDLTEGYIVYNVCQSNTWGDMGKIHSHSK